MSSKMTIKKITLFILIILIPISGIFALEISSKEAEAFLNTGYNRSYGFFGGISAKGYLELENCVLFKAGIALGSSEYKLDINTFLGANYYPFTGNKYLLPLNFSVSYIYNGLPEFKAHTHSILPVVSYSTDRAGISIGSNFRFSSFFGEPAQFESIFSFFLFFNFINMDIFKAGISIGTFNDFEARNMGAYALGINTKININNNWSVLNEYEVLQSGGDGFSTTFYALSIRIGARYSW